MRRVWLVFATLGLGVSLVYAQTPASQANESQWKQTPEGRPAAPSTDMNCSGSVTRGDNGNVTTTSNCPAAQDQPVPSNAAQQFPYPGETKPSSQATPAQQTPNTPQSPPNAAKQFPFPGEQPQGTPSSSSSGNDAKPTPPSGFQDAGSSGSSSSSSNSSSSSSSTSGLPSDSGDSEPDDTSVPTRTRSSRNRPAQPVKTPNQREAEDLQVAGFYQNDGNFMGAYLRAKDAVTIAADDPDAHLALAEAARKLGKLDEAEQNYRKCLQLDPVPKTKKVAQQALKDMTGG
ncbi:MAG TPA: tetratricopeptide repeat protein [Acidobacteriaceae bacterium]|jgi:hypothetical protein